MGLGRAQIDEAVKHSGWQKFRVSLKGQTTERKIKRLAYYYLDRNWLTLGRPGNVMWEYGELPTQDDVYVQILNYLNALSRGGQIEPLPKQDFTWEELGSLLWDKGIKVRR